MKVGYAKLGRSISLPSRLWGTAGDHEAPQLLRRLAIARPDVEWVLIGRSRGWEEWDAPDNVTNPWNALNVPSLLMSQEDEKRGHAGFVAHALVMINEAVRALYPVWNDLDGLVIWLGQHGGAHIPIPRLGTHPESPYVKPYLFAVNYGGYLNAIVNLWQDAREGRGPCVALCADPRNFLKARDVKWPFSGSVFAQHSYVRTHKHYRYGDTRRPEDLGIPGRWSDEGGGCWVTDAAYEHGAVELAALPDDWQTWGDRAFDRRHPVGVASTAFWVNRKEYRRSWYLKEWILRAAPRAELFVKPDAKSAQELDGTTLYDNPSDAFHDVLARWRTTVTLPPPAGRGQWTVAKPWQCFAARTACFHIGPGDALGWILPTRSRVAPAQEIAPGWFSIREDWAADDLVLADWLRVRDPDDLARKLDAASTSRETWEWLVGRQRDLLTRRWGELERNVLARLGLHAAYDGVPGRGPEGVFTRA